MLEELLSKIGQVQDKAGAKTVFGDPVQVNGRTIIPVAKIQYGYGFGMGRGPQRSADADRGQPQGGGGGAGVSVRPVAVIEIADGQTKVKPVVDATRLALAWMLLVAWSVFWITRTVRVVARARR